MSEAKEKLEKLHCNLCGPDKNHRIIFTRKQPGDNFDDYGDGENWCYTFDLAECCGCDSVTLRRSFWFSETDGVDEVFYPPRVGRAAPDWHGALPRDMKNLLSEIYAALQADSRSLAVMGIRALVDMVFTDKVGDVGRFDEKLEALEKKGFVSRVNREVLQVVLEAGHAAAHRGHSAGIAEISTLMDILENLLQAVYILESDANLLKAGIPPRPPRSPKKQSSP